MPGRWGGCGIPVVGEEGGGEQRSQRRRSMSWQDLVSREGAEVRSRRQLPLDIVRFVCVGGRRITDGIWNWELEGEGNVPHVAVCKVPPAHGLGVIDGEDVAYNFVLKQQFAEKHIVRTVAEDMANGEDSGGLSRAIGEQSLVYRNDVFQVRG